MDKTPFLQGLIGAGLILRGFLSDSSFWSPTLKIVGLLVLGGAIFRYHDSPIEEEEEEDEWDPAP